MQRYCPCACTSLAEYADHQQQVYDTQGLIVNKSLHQQFADEFQRALPQLMEREKVQTVPYSNKLNCFNHLGTDTIAAKIIDVDYYNKGFCRKSSK